MVRTKTSSANSLGEAGVTLIEMLAALAIAASLATFVAMSLSGTRAARSLDEATTQLGSDLRAARSQALLRGEPIVLRPTPDGYTIEALSIERQWDRRLTAHWQIPVQARSPARVERFEFSPTRLSQAGLVITLEEGERTRVLEVGAVTGRVNERS